MNFGTAIASEQISGRAIFNQFRVGKSLSNHACSLERPCTSIHRIHGVVRNPRVEGRGARRVIHSREGSIFLLVFICGDLGVRFCLLGVFADRQLY